MNGFVDICARSFGRTWPCECDACQRFEATPPDCSRCGWREGAVEVNGEFVCEDCDQEAA